MSLNPCLDCNQPISETAASCPHCGFDQRAHQDWQKRKIALVIGTVIIIGCVIILFFMLSKIQRNIVPADQMFVKPGSARSVNTQPQPRRGTR